MLKCCSLSDKPQLDQYRIDHEQDKDNINIILKDDILMAADVLLMVFDHIVAGWMHI